MSITARLEGALAAALEAVDGAGRPPRLSAAMAHAVFPGGARVRPRLTLAVARACGCDDLELSLGAAVSIELLHCASLVHDDLPCFDDAPLRRGRPSVHRAYGERLAVLCGGLPGAGRRGRALAAAAGAVAGTHCLGRGHADGHRRRPGLGVRAAGGAA
ncbi:polyprenyl synthetase family protein [Piscinibacter sakaiensis]|uniref:polyprenyl synthetase family protein n=1 Tax=Piscinibacter sakaiensis TaxID=1547922 RepID=UPI00372AFE2E